LRETLTGLAPGVAARWIGREGGTTTIVVLAAGCVVLSSR
jgi:hypothetical protein